MKSPGGVGREGVQEHGSKPASSPPSPVESPYQGAGSVAQHHTEEYETDANVLEMPSLTLCPEGKDKSTIIRHWFGSDLLC